MAKTLGQQMFGHEEARINVYSVTNPSMQFDISVPVHAVDQVVNTVPIAGEMWYNDPDYYHAGYAEPLCDMLEEYGIPYILHSDLDTNVVIEVPFV
jgi:hypothetical protein